MWCLASEQQSEAVDYPAGRLDRKIAGRKGKKLADFRWVFP